jgi:hypothetical protein
LVARHQHTVDLAVANTRELLARLDDHGYFSDHGLARDVVRRACSSSPEAVAWSLGTRPRPPTFAELASSLATVGLTFVGAVGAGSLRSLPTPELAELLDDTPDPVLREAMTEVATKSDARLDLFRRGARRVDASARLARLRQLPVAVLDEGAPPAIADAETLGTLYDRAGVVAEIGTWCAQQMASGELHPVRMGWEPGPIDDRGRRLSAALASFPEGMYPALTVVPATGSAVVR